MRSFILVTVFACSTLTALAQAPKPSPPPVPPSPSTSSAPDEPDRTTGCVRGVVVDSSGNPVKKVIVSIKDVSLGLVEKTTQTDLHGKYEFCLLQGDYSIWASKEALATQPEQILINSDAVTKNLVLK